MKINRSAFDNHGKGRGELRLHLLLQPGDTEGTFKDLVLPLYRLAAHAIGEEEA